MKIEEGALYDGRLAIQQTSAAEMIPLRGKNEDWITLFRYEGGRTPLKMRARVDSQASLHLDHHLEDPADDVHLGAAGRGQDALQHNHGGHLAAPWSSASLWQPSQMLLLLLQKLLLF